MVSLETPPPQAIPPPLHRARARLLSNADRMAHQGAEQGASRPPAGAAATDDPVRRHPLRPAPRSSPTGGGVGSAMENGLRCSKFPQTLHGFIYGDGEAHRGDNYGHFINTQGKSVPLIDPSFTFLTKLPAIQKIVLLGSCNGLLLFRHRQVSDVHDTLGYIVCNPATEQWVAVPSSGRSPRLREDYYVEEVLAHLIFDPAASPHFQLVQLWQTMYGNSAGIHTYSSETGVWKQNNSRDWKQWGSDGILSTFVGCPFNGRLHVKVDESCERRSIIVAVDGEGKTSRIMRWPEKRGFPEFVFQSHGHLYCVSEGIDDSDMVTELSIWALEDYSTEEWVLKHRVSIMKLFGKMNCRFDSYEVVTIHILTAIWPSFLSMGTLNLTVRKWTIN